MNEKSKNEAVKTEHFEVRGDDFQRDIDRRLATVAGHIKAVREMMMSGRDCLELVQQLLAIDKSVRKAGIALLNNHLNHCMADAINEGSTEKIAQFGALMEMFL